MAHTILVVDDIGDNLELIGTILSNEGYGVASAMTGRQALDTIEQCDIDLVLLDVVMPGVDGFEVCRRIKQLPDKKDIPIIFLSALTDRDDILKGLGHGAVDYVTKPCNSKELLARVKTHLQLKTAQDEIARKNKELQQKNERLQQLNAELQYTLEKVERLEGIIPICSFCKNIRDDKGYWSRVDEYITKHSRAKFSHSLCPDCVKKHYPIVDLHLECKEKP